MKRVISLAIVAATLSLAPAVLTAKTATSEPASKPASKPARTHKAFEGFWVQLAEELKLSDDQKDKIGSLLEARRSEIEPIREKVDANVQKLKDARAKSDKDEVAKIRAEQAVLRQQEVQIREKYEPQIFAIMTPEQKAGYDRHFVLMRIWKEFSAADLTSEQQAKIKAEFPAKTQSVDVSNKAGRDQAFEKVSAWVRSDVLTPKQKDALKAGATSKPADGANAD